MLHDYSPERLRSLRKRAMLTQRKVVELTGICEVTLYNVEKGITRPQTKTLDKLLNLYAMRIQHLKNLKNILEEPFNGGYISSEAIIRVGSPGLDARRT